MIPNPVVELHADLCQRQETALHRCDRNALWGVMMDDAVDIRSGVVDRPMNDRGRLICLAGLILDGAPVSADSDQLSCRDLIEMKSERIKKNPVRIARKSGGMMCENSVPQILQVKKLIEGGQINTECPLIAIWTGPFGWRQPWAVTYVVHAKSLRYRAALYNEIALDLARREMVLPH